MPIPLRVLLIESSETDPATLLAHLQRGGYDPSWRRVDSAPALEDALAEEWDIALCSWHLPGFSGSQALAMLRARRSDLPVVVTSSDRHRDRAVDAMKAGADDFVALPDGVAAHALAPLLPVVDRVLRQAEVCRVRRRAEVALRESGERFAQAFERAPIGMAIVGIDGITLQVNPAFCDMFGYSEAEMAGLPVWRVTHPDDMPATIEQLQRLIEGESDAWHLEKRYFHRDGHMIWARCTTWLVRGPDGMARYVVSHLQDITGQKRLEEQMRRQQAELAHVLRVATMGEMVAEIAHEINQPLGSIANFANALAHRLDDVDMMRAAAAHIASEALRAGDVIRRLRGFLRKGESKRERCAVDDIVRDAVRLMEPEMREHRIALTLDLTAARSPIEIDRVQVVQVVLNLLRNSVEAIAAANNGTRRVDVHTAADASDMVVVAIRDSGIGLPVSRSAEIFDPFFTTKERGLGLGLSISRSIIEAHEGRLWARPNVDEGATVGFCLPVRRD